MQKLLREYISQTGFAVYLQEMADLCTPTCRKWQIYAHLPAGNGRFMHTYLQEMADLCTPTCRQWQIYEYLLAEKE